MDDGHDDARSSSFYFSCRSSIRSQSEASCAIETSITSSSAHGQGSDDVSRSSIDGTCFDDLDTAPSYSGYEYQIHPNSSFQFDFDIESVPSLQAKSRWYNFRRKNSSFPDERSECPNGVAGFVSRATFQWTWPLIKNSMQRLLHANDIWLLKTDDKVKHITDNVHNHYQQSVTSQLLWQSWTTSRRHIWLGGATMFCSVFCKVGSPFALRFFIEYLQRSISPLPTHRSQLPEAEGIGMATVVIGLYIIRIVADTHHNFQAVLDGAKLQSSLMFIMFRKSLRYSTTRSLAGANTQIVSSANEGKKAESPTSRRCLTPEHDMLPYSELFEDDLLKVYVGSIDIHLLWACPLTILLALAALCLNMAYSALTGVALVVIGSVVTIIINQCITKYKKALQSQTDARLSQQQEAYNHFYFLKSYGRSGALLNCLLDFRQREIVLLQSLHLIIKALDALVQLTHTFAPLLTFILFSIINHHLDPARVFSSLAIFSTIHLPLRQLPEVMNNFIQAQKSLQRIERFLRYQHHKDSTVWDLDSKFAISIESADASQSPVHTFPAESALPRSSNHVPRLNCETPSIPSLQSPVPLGGYTQNTNIAPHSPDPRAIRTLTSADKDVDVRFRPRDLVGVVSLRGSAKPSFLANLAGISAAREQITFNGTRTYCPAAPWIGSRSIRETILFDTPMDRDWYEKVLDACCLRSDINLLPDGDLTILGNAPSVSKNLKQKLHLARAVYSDSRILLFDEPFADMQAFERQTIFDEAICGLLAKRCRVIATSRLEVLQRCDRVIWLHEGRVRASNTFENLSRDADFQQTLAIITQQFETQTFGPAFGTVDVQDISLASDKSSYMHHTQISSIKALIDFVKISSPLLLWTIPLFMLVLFQCSSLATNLWLAYFTSNRFRLPRNTYIAIYVGMAGLQVALFLLFKGTTTLLTTRSSCKHYKLAATAIFKIPPRISSSQLMGTETLLCKDIETVDQGLISAMQEVLLRLAAIVGLSLVSTYFYHWSAIAITACLLLVAGLLSAYDSAAHEVRRHKSQNKSAMTKTLQDGLSGGEIICAHGTERCFIRRLQNSIDDFNAVRFMESAIQSWINLRLGLVYALLMLGVVINIMFVRSSTDPSISGFVLAYLLSTTEVFQDLARETTNLRTASESVKRLTHCATKLPREFLFSGIAKMRPSWPETGTINFENVELSDPGHNMITPAAATLRGVNIFVPGGQRLAIMGCTDAEKALIPAVLSRFIRPTKGKASIDGADVTKVMPADLRAHVTHVLAFPSLFQGTMRSNLDPYNKHTDLELWSVLRETELVVSDSDDDDNASKEDSSPSIPSSPTPPPLQLDSPVDKDGTNFSAGQRYLLALATVVLRNSKIVIYEDPGDPRLTWQSKKKIADVVERCFRGKTVLYLTDNVRAAMEDCDRICVVNDGRMVELGVPWDLWNRNGVFRAMCAQQQVDWLEVPRP